jgi:hypothetical protein
MDAQLEKDLANRGAILKHTLAVAEKYLSRQASLPPGGFVPDITQDDLPDFGPGALETLQFFEKNYAHLITNSAGPRYFGFVTGGSTPAAVAGDWLVSAYDQNV